VLTIVCMSGGTKSYKNRPEMISNAGDSNQNARHKEQACSPVQAGAQDSHVSNTSKTAKFIKGDITQQHMYI